MKWIHTSPENEFSLAGHFFCPVCGGEHFDNSDVCEHCGAVVDEGWEELEK
jgi:uncharacterized OB-fold protein